MSQIYLNLLFHLFEYILVAALVKKKKKTYIGRGYRVLFVLSFNTILLDCLVLGHMILVCILSV